MASPVASHSCTDSTMLTTYLNVEVSDIPNHTAPGTLQKASMKTKAQECDATGAAIRTTAGYKII